MLDPKEEATRLVERHYNASYPPKDSNYQAKEHAIIDVQNTIDALGSLPFNPTDEDGFILRRIIFFNQVKEHIKQL